MKNKVLINLYIPSIDYDFELYIPVNESIDHVFKIIIKMVSELSDIELSSEIPHYLLDPDTGFIYGFSQIVRDTNIRNNKKIILI